GLAAVQRPRAEQTPSAERLGDALRLGTMYWGRECNQHKGETAKRHGQGAPLLVLRARSPDASLLRRKMDDRNGDLLFAMWRIARGGLSLSFERLFHPRGIAIIGASADITRSGSHP